MAIDWSGQEEDVTIDYGDGECDWKIDVSRARRIICRQVYLESKNPQAVQDIFRNLAREFGQTIICVTHDTDFAENTNRTVYE